MQHVKDKYRTVFTALRTELKGIGGLDQLAAHLGKSYGTVANKFNPDYQNSEPTLEDFLEALEFANASRTVNVLASLVGHVTIPVGDHASPANIQDGTTAFLNSAIAAVGLGFRASGAPHLSQRDKSEQLDAITQLIQSAVALQSALRG